MSTEVLKMALEKIARVNACDYEYQAWAREALNHCEDNLHMVKQEQGEPVAAYGYCPKCGAEGTARERRPDGNDICANGHIYKSRNSITTPQQRKPLTDEQIYDMYNEPRSDAEMLAFARAIEAAHGIKENT